MALIAIFGVALATGFATIFVGGYKLRDPWESTRTGRNLVVEIDEQVARTAVRRIATDTDRSAQCFAAWPQQIVGHETTVTEGPEQFIHAARGF